MSDATPSKTERKTLMKNAPSLRSAVTAAGNTAASAVNVAGERIGGAAVGAVSGVARNVISPIASAALLQQLPMLGTAMGAIGGIIRDIKEGASARDQLQREQENADRIGKIAENTGETVTNLDDLEIIMSQLSETIYEGVYEGVQDGISKLIGDFFNDVGSGIQDALGEFVEQGGDIEDVVGSLQEKLMAFLNGGDREGEQEYRANLLDSVQNIEEMLGEFLSEIMDDRSDNKFDAREKSMEGNSKGPLGLIDKAKNGLEDMLQNMSNIMALGGLGRIFSLIVGVIGSIIGVVTTVLLSPLKLILSGLAALATPVGLVVAAIAAIVAAVTYVAWKLGDGDIIAGFKKMGEWIWKTLTELPAKVIDWVKGIPDRVVAFLTDPLGNIKAQADNLVSGVVGAYKGFTDFFSEEIAAIRNFIEGIFPNIFEKIASIGNFIEGIFPNIFDNIQKGLEGANEAIKTAVMGFINYLASIPEKVTEWVKDQVRDIPFIGNAIVDASDTKDSLQGQAIDAVSNVADAWWKSAMKMLDGNKDQKVQTEPVLVPESSQFSTGQQDREKDIQKALTDLKRTLDTIQTSSSKGIAMQNNQSNVTNNMSTIGQQFIPRPRDVSPRKIMYGY